MRRRNRKRKRKRIVAYVQHNNLNGKQILVNRKERPKVLREEELFLILYKVTERPQDKQIDNRKTENPKSV